MKKERGLSEKQGLGDRRNYRHLNQSWLARKLQKRQRVADLKSWCTSEMDQFGMTLHGVRENGNFKWL